MQWTLLAGLLASSAFALPASVEKRDAPVWAADYSPANVDSTGAGFGRVQYQYEGSSQANYDPGKTPGKNWAIPIVTHPQLGRALKIHLDGAYTDPNNASNNTPAMMRWEALPKPGAYFDEGEEGYFRMDFVLDADFPVGRTNTWNLVNQIHQGSDTGGSPPVEFDVYNNQLYAQGEGSPGTPYKQALAAVQVNTVYKLVYHVKFSATAANSVIDVWVNNNKVLGGATGFVPSVPTLTGGKSYWKGATAYCKPGLAPFTVYQTNHRWGRTYASVN